jgi:hypothetical protein
MLRLSFPTANPMCYSHHDSGHANISYLVVVCAVAPSCEYGIGNGRALSHMQRRLARVSFNVYIRIALD